MTRAVVPYTRRYRGRRLLTGSLHAAVPCVMSHRAGFIFLWAIATAAIVG